MFPFLFRLDLTSALTISLMLVLAEVALVAYASPVQGARRIKLALMLLLSLVPGLMLGLAVAWLWHWLSP